MGTSIATFDHDGRIYELGNALRMDDVLETLGKLQFRPVVDAEDFLKVIRPHGLHASTAFGKDLHHIRELVLSLGIIVG